MLLRDTWLCYTVEPYLSRKCGKQTVCGVESEFIPSKREGHIQPGFSTLCNRQGMYCATLFQSIRRGLMLWWQLGLLPGILFTAREVGCNGNENNWVRAETSASKVVCVCFLGQLKGIINYISQSMYLTIFWRYFGISHFKESYRFSTVGYHST